MLSFNSISYLVLQHLYLVFQLLSNIFCVHRNRTETKHNVCPHIAYRLADSNRTSKMQSISKCKGLCPESQNNLLPKPFHLLCQIIPAHRQEMEINSNSDSTSGLLSLSAETVPEPWKTVIHIVQKTEPANQNKNKFLKISYEQSNSQPK